jgi:hypothetical protein
MFRGPAILLAALFFAGCATTKKHRAPRRQALSPIGRYVVTAETPTEKKAQRNLVITRPGEKSEILRFPFVQQVEVVWAPDESAVAIVDAMPNETRVLIFALPSGNLLFELRKDQTCLLNALIPCGFNYANVYFSNVIWLAPDRIQVSLRMINPQIDGVPPVVATDLQVPFDLQK